MKLVIIFSLFTMIFGHILTPLYPAIQATNNLLIDVEDSLFPSNTLKTKNDLHVIKPQFTEKCSYSETFGSPYNTGPWSTYTDKNYDMRIKNGKFVFTGSNSSGPGIGFFGCDARSFRWDIDIEVLQNNNGPDPEFGQEPHISMDFLSNDEIVSFRIYPDGYYEVDLWGLSSEEYELVIPRTYSSAINTGVATNHFFMILERYKLTFGVNGHVLSSYCDTAYVSPHTSFNLQLQSGISTTIYTVDNIKISSISLLPAFVFGKVTIPDPNHIKQGPVPLENMRVELIKDGNSIMSNTTHDSSKSAGSYCFVINIPQAGSYSIRAKLEEPSNAANGRPGYEVKYLPPLLNDPVPTLETWRFNLDLGTSTLRDIEFTGSFVNNSGTSNLDNTGQGRLYDMATMYYDAQKVEQFATKEMGVRDLPPYKILAFVNNNDKNGTAYDPSNKEIRILERDSSAADSGRPMNRIWHEFFHHLMNNTISRYTTPSCGSHKGFLNSNTSDSWQEGWAAFWPVVLGEYLGFPNASKGYYANIAGLEANYTPWTAERNNKGIFAQREDIAVASLLWDLYDQDSSHMADAEEDHLSLPIEEMVELLINRDASDKYIPINTVQELYKTLANDGSLGLYFNYGLDEIFKAHGFFGDKGWVVNSSNPCAINYKGDKIFQANEVIGMGGRAGRPSIPEVEGANLLMNLIDSNGIPIKEGLVNVDFLYAPPFDVMNQTLQFSVISGKYLHLEPPPSESPLTLKVSGTDSNSPVFMIDSQDYWRTVDSSNKDFVEEVTVVNKPVYHLFLPLTMKIE